MYLLQFHDFRINSESWSTSRLRANGARRWNALSVSLVWRGLSQNCWWLRTGKKGNISLLLSQYPRSKCNGQDTKISHRSRELKCGFHLSHCAFCSFNSSSCFVKTSTPFPSKDCWIFRGKLTDSHAIINTVFAYLDSMSRASIQATVFFYDNSSDSLP